MVDRQQRYVSYLLSHAHRAAVDGGDPGLASAAALGVQDGRGERALRTIAEVEAEVQRLEGASGADVAGMARNLEQAMEAVKQVRAMADQLREEDRETRAILDAGPDETTPAAARRVVAMVPDVGPTERDERERNAAAKHLQRLILADGKTDTGGRWLYDAAADEIVRLRAELSGARHAAQFPAHDETRRVLGAGREEATSDAARRVVAERDAFQMATEEGHEVAACLRKEANEAREQGAAEMRERAAQTVRLSSSEMRNDVAEEILALPIDGGAMARRGAAGERVAAALDGQQGGLSAEDSATLKGAGWLEEPHAWRDPRGLVWHKENAVNIDSLRYIAAELRAKAPAVAHMGPPGKAAGGEENATAGKGSVAEDPRGAQGPALRPCSPVYRVGDPCPIGCMTHLYGTCPLNREIGEQHRARAAAPVAIPKPKRVEVGQRWAHRNHPQPFTVRDVSRHNDDMLCVLATADGHTVRVVESWLRSSDLWSFLGPAPAPHGPDGGPEKGDEGPVLVSGPVENHGDPTPRGAYVIGPIARGQQAEANDPTARDAVAGMLLRYGRIADARDLASGAVGPAEMAADLRRHVLTGSDRDACVVALEALARGELCARIERGEPPTVGLDGDAVEELFDAARGVRLAVPKGADARAVLATVAELLGLPDQRDERRRLEDVFNAAMAWAAGVDGADARLRSALAASWRIGAEPTPEPVAAPDREALGRAVHTAAESSIFMKAEWDNLSPASREWRCAVGERLFAMGARHGRGEAFRAGLEHGERATNAAWKTATGFATPLDAVTCGGPSKAAGFYATGGRATAPVASAAPGVPESHAGDAGVPCASCGKATSTGGCFGCTVAGRFLKPAPPPAKPSSVLPRQRWRCVGLEAQGELEVWPASSAQPGEVTLFPVGSLRATAIRARAADMLGLREWTFVSGPCE